MSTPLDAQDAWYAQLRRQLLAIARRRVEPDAAEDLVQDALRIIAERGATLASRDEVAGLPPLAWCLQVLRNVIGNHYRRLRTRRRVIHPSADPEMGSPLLETLDPEMQLQIIEEALEELTARDPNCGAYLRRLAEETAVHAIAAEHGLEVNALYQRLYRCRRKLRDILSQRGILP